MFQIDYFYKQQHDLLGNSINPEVRPSIPLWEGRGQVGGRVTQCGVDFNWNIQRIWKYKNIRQRGVSLKLA
jgi:hypothetical protein